MDSVVILSYFLKWLFCLVSFCLDKETARATARFGKLHIQQEKGAAPNGSRMIVFSTARNLTTLAVAEHLNWIGDGTFYVAPRITSQSYSFPAVTTTSPTGILVTFLYYMYDFVNNKCLFPVITQRINMIK